jgi:peptide deformylase
MSDDIFVFNTEDAVKGRIETQKVSTFNLVEENHPLLSEKLQDFDFENPPYNPNEFASALVETCKKHRGFGLSANQCGFKFKVFVMGDPEGEYVAFFNPKILDKSLEEVHMSEGCLSFPQLFLNITRPESIIVEYQDFTGEKKTARFSGLSARVFLHEYDHMNGITFTKRAKPLALQTGIKKRKKLYDRFRKATKAVAARVRT